MTPEARSRVSEGLRCDIDRIIGERSKEQWLADSTKLSQYTLAESIWHMLRPDIEGRRLEDKPSEERRADAGDPNTAFIHDLVQTLGHPRDTEDSLMERISSLPDELIVMILRHYIRREVPQLNPNINVYINTPRMLRHIPRIYALYETELLTETRFRVNWRDSEFPQYRHISIFRSLYTDSKGIMDDLMQVTRKFDHLQTVSVKLEAFESMASLQNFMFELQEKTKCNLVCVRPIKRYGEEEVLFFSRWKGVKGCWLVDCKKHTAVHVC